jgi:hypothetical protein
LDTGVDFVQFAVNDANEAVGDPGLAAAFFSEGVSLRFIAQQRHESQLHGNQLATACEAQQAKPRVKHGATGRKGRTKVKWVQGFKPCPPEASSCPVFLPMFAHHPPAAPSWALDLWRDPPPPDGGAWRRRGRGLLQRRTVWRIEANR